MDTNEILSKINEVAGGMVLEKARFGRSGLLSVWLEARAIVPVAKALKADPRLGLDWLENLSVAQVGQALIVSYLVRSTTTDAIVMLRCSLELTPGNEKSWIDLPSVRSIWPMSEPFEAEVSELFGIRFGTRHSNLLPDGWQGFPLRKSYNVGPRGEEAGS